MKKFIAFTFCCSLFMIINGCVPPGSGDTGSDFFTETSPGDGLAWPVECSPDTGCIVGYADIDDNNMRYDCGSPGYKGHEGTDIPTTKGVNIYAADDGVVAVVKDNRYDDCTNTGAAGPDSDGDGEGDCKAPGWIVNGTMDGVAFQLAGGNAIVIKHTGSTTYYATRYDHIKTGSALVTVGQNVIKGDKIAEVGSAGASTGPHLHFEVWEKTPYDPVNPWPGACEPNKSVYMWQDTPAWNGF